MPKMTAITAILLVILLDVGFPQNCELAGTPAWSQEIRYVIGDCDNQFPSPDGKRLLRIDTEGKIHVIDEFSGNTIQIRTNVVQPPAMVSWAPKSDAFFVNDGEGSGMSSIFRLFTEKNGQFVEDTTIQAKAVGLYRNREKCSSAAANPNVWGIGWSRRGTRIHLFIQTTVNDPCGRPGSFIVVTVNRADASVLEEFAGEVAKKKFRNLLPPDVYSK